MGLILSPQLVGSMKAYGIKYAALFDGATGYLSRTPLSAGNRKTWTLSFWVSRNALGNSGGLFSAGASGSTDDFYVGYNSSEELELGYYSSGYNHRVQSSSAHRDTAAFDHFVIQHDTTEASGTDRVKFIHNGVDVTDTATSFPSANYDNHFNKVVAHYIGSNLLGSFNDCLLADVHFVDGAIVPASDFGTLDLATGNWIAKRYTGSYGTNGFHLDFSDENNLGRDVSGNTSVTPYTQSQAIGSASAGTSIFVDVTFKIPNNTTVNKIGYYDTVPASAAELYIVERTSSGSYTPRAKITGVSHTGSGSYEYTSLALAYTIPATGDFHVAVKLDTTATHSLVSPSTPRALLTGSDLTLGTSYAFTETITTLGCIPTAVEIEGVWWTVNGTVTQVTSTPTKTFATLNPLIPTLSSLTTNGNLKSLRTLAGGHYIPKATLPLKGKMFFEAHATLSNYTGWYLGFCTASSTTTAAASGELGDQVGEWAVYAGNQLNQEGSVTTPTDITTPTSANDYWCWAVDVDAGEAWLGSHSGGTITWEGGGDPDSGTSPTLTFSTNEDIYAAVAGSDYPVINFGQNGWNTTDAPATFGGVCTDNLPKQPGKLSDHMATVLYTGNGSTQSITGAGFDCSVGSLIWMKDSEVARSHALFDTLRGAQKRLYTDVTNAENTNANFLTSFDTDGFSVGSDVAVNASGENFVAWCWSLPSFETNTSGDISVNWEYNATLGMAAGVYTGSGVAGHTLGLPSINGKAPSMIIIKCRSHAQEWRVYHKDVGATKYGELNGTGSFVTLSTIWNNTEPTSSFVTLGTAGTVNLSSYTYVIYCFWETDFCKIGSYTGNGSSDGPFVNTGGQPVWMMDRCTSAVGNWGMWDTERDTYNVANKSLVANSSGMEGAVITGDHMDFLSNGLKLRTDTSDLNTSGRTYIYLAFVNPQGSTEVPAR